MTSKELTEQAFALYRRLLEIEGLSDFSSPRAKRLRHIADLAHIRYERRLHKSSNE